MPSLKEGTTKVKNHFNAAGKGVKGFLGKKQPGGSGKFNAQKAYGMERSKLLNKEREEELAKAQKHREKQGKAQSRREAEEGE